MRIQTRRPQKRCPIQRPLVPLLPARRTTSCNSNSNKVGSLYQPLASLPNPLKACWLRNTQRLQLQSIINGHFNNHNKGFRHRADNHTPTRWPKWATLCHYSHLTWASSRIHTTQSRCSAIQMSMTLLGLRPGTDRRLNFSLTTTGPTPRDSGATRVETMRTRPRLSTLVYDARRYL